MKDRLDVQRAKAEKLSGQTAGKRSNLGAEMSASPRPAPRVQQMPPNPSKRAVSPPGYAKGGKVKKHDDAAQDKRLIANMIAANERKEGEKPVKMKIGGKAKCMAKGGAVPPHKAHHHMGHSSRRQGL